MRWLALLLISSVANAAPCPKAVTAAFTKAMFGDTPVSLTPTCKPVRAKHPVTLVEASVLEDTMTLGNAAIVDPKTNAVLWSRTSLPTTPGHVSTITLVDLDGDGYDELVEHEVHIGHMAMGSETLIAYDIGDGTISDGGLLPLSFTGREKSSDQNDCTATWAVVGGAGRYPRVQITGKRGTNPKLSPAFEGCPLEGTHRYRWVRGAFVLAD